MTTALCRPSSSDAIFFFLNAPFVEGPFLPPPALKDMGGDSNGALRGVTAATRASASSIFFSSSMFEVEVVHKGVVGSSTIRKKVMATN